MKSLSLYWGYLKGEHLSDEQLANVDFGNPSLDIEFIIFDPLASSYFQGTFFILNERKFYFPHRSLPSMKTENIIVYEDTKIKIIDPPSDLETPVGIFLCFFFGKKPQIKRAIEFLGEKINLRFSPCDLDIDTFCFKLSKTRLEVLPISMTVSDLKIDDYLKGNLEVFMQNLEIFQQNLKNYKPKIQTTRLLIKEVNFQTEIEVNINGTIIFEKDIFNLNVLNTIYDVASRSVYTGNK